MGIWAMGSEYDKSNIIKAMDIQSLVLTVIVYRFSHLSSRLAEVDIRFVFTLEEGCFPIQLCQYSYNGKKLVKQQEKTILKHHLELLL